MKQHEAKSSISFRHWIEQNPQQAGVYENKDTRGKESLPFSEVTEDQTRFLLRCQSDKGVLVRHQATNAGEADYFYYRNSPAWIVIKYPKSIEVIPLDLFLLEKSQSSRKSLTYSRACEISTVSIVHS